jgi:MTH538 TIR-like domain (DUF1863)
MNVSGPTATAFKYRAFISYSHHDRRSAEWLHKALENYRIPKQLIGETGRDGEIQKQIFPIFRDREELGSSHDLSGSIRDALAQSAYLIVICSPAAAKSRWVNQEIIEFKKLGRAERIHAIIIDGEPNSDSLEAECLPTALRFKVDALGTILHDQTVEPLAADLRPDGDGKNEAKLKLIAGLLGISLNDLRRREIAAARRRKHIAQTLGAAIIVLVASVGIAAWLAWSFRDESQAKNLPGIIVETRDTTLDLSKWRETTDDELANKVKKSLAISKNKFTVIRTGKQASEFVHRMGTSSGIKPEVQCSGCRVEPRYAGDAARAPNEWDIVFDISDLQLEEKRTFEFSVLFWNAFQNPEQFWGGFRILHSTELSVFTIEFPPTRRPLPTTLAYSYFDKKEHPYDKDVEASLKTDETGRVAKVTWKVPTPRGDRSYRLRWDWRQ